MKRKSVVQIIVQEKIADGSGDWRAFCICQDSEGDTWELRGYGASPGEAAQDAYSHYQMPEEDWDIFGYVVGKCSSCLIGNQDE